MTKYSNEERRNEIVGLGTKSIRKNYYRSLNDKKRDLEEKNIELEKEILRRSEAEDALKSLNRELEGRIRDRTAALELSNEQLSETLENLKKSYKYLVEAEKLASLNHLVVGISHEINTPIGVSLTTASYLNSLIAQLKMSVKLGSLEKNELEDMIRKMETAVSMILDSANKSAELIADFKQTATTQQKYLLKDFEIKHYLEMLFRSFAKDFERYDNISLEIDVKDTLLINSYPTMYAQLLRIFVKNTMDHGFEKDGGKICLSFKKIDNHFSFVYKDDGKGMIKEHQKHLFEPFFTTQRSGDMTGLGLFTVYNIIKSVNGEIVCKTEENEGFEIQILLPLKHRMIQKS